MKLFQLFAFLSFLLVCPAMGDDDDDEEDVKCESWVKDGGFIILVFAVLQMFYALALVVEEYFVPALNTMCEKYNIPDDVAGATFMAAGASSPELFAAFVSLFLTHSSLGVGTILGSEIFNHLIITAGSIYFSSGPIIAEPRFIGREAFFYALALIGLLWALSKNSHEQNCYDQLSSKQRELVDKNNDIDFICLDWYKPLGLIFGYVIYALVCGYYQRLVPFFCPISEPSHEEHREHIKSIEHEVKQDVDTHIEVYEMAALEEGITEKSALIRDTHLLRSEDQKEEDVDDVLRGVGWESPIDLDKLDLGSPIEQARTHSDALDSFNPYEHSEESTSASSSVNPPSTAPSVATTTNDMSKVTVSLTQGTTESNKKKTSKMITASPAKNAGPMKLSGKVPGPKNISPKKIEIQIPEATESHLEPKRKQRELPTDKRRTEFNYRPVVPISPKVLEPLPPSTEQPLLTEHPITTSAGPPPPHLRFDTEKDDTKMRIHRGTSLDRGTDDLMKCKVSHFHSHHSIKEIGNYLEESYTAFDLFITSVAPNNIIPAVTVNLHKMEKKVHSFGCWMWKQSKFFTKIHYNKRAWQLRWCEVDKDGFRSMRFKGQKKGLHWYKSFIVEIIDAKAFIMRIRSRHSDVYFKAQGKDVFKNILRAFSLYQEMYAHMLKEKEKELRLESIEHPVVMKKSNSHDHLHHLHHLDDHQEHEHQHIVTILDWPETKIDIFFHIINLPVKAALHYMIPDCRVPGQEDKYLQAIFMSVFFLAIFSYIMTGSMELLGPFFGVSPFIMGVVFGAAGTSFPNVFASLVVARQGLGNEAISNALGGNVFNIFIGLGVPWFCYILFGPKYMDHNHYVYTGLRAGGIIFPIFVLLVLLLLFILALFCTGWKLYRSHAHVAILAYAGFIAWVFMTSMVIPDWG